MTTPLTGQRVTVMGLGTRRGGLGVARWLVSQGAIVTVTDLRTEDQLADSISELEGLPIRFVLGRHDDHDFTKAGADIVVRNPGVRRWSPYLAMARESGVRIEMEMSLFLAASPAPVIGITGTKGKTTTSTLAGLMLSAWDPRTVVAGNMGVSALDRLVELTPDTPVVLEISSWQVEATDERRLSPQIGVITNVSEDHLDTYDSFAEYAAVKRSLVAHQRGDAVAVLNADDPEVSSAAKITPARVVWYGSGDESREGVWVTDAGLRIVDDAGVRLIPWPASWRAAGHGTHLLLNAAAAAAAAIARGAPDDAIARGLEAFAGVKDRDEFVAEIGGVRYVNDTAATAPAAAVAALSRYGGGRVHWITGGADKKLDFAPLADAGTKAATVYLLEGTATPRIAELLAARGIEPAGIYSSMSSVVEAAAGRAQDGDVVLLSPGCASFGLFRDEFDRGEQFRQAVRSLMTTVAGR